MVKVERLKCGMVNCWLLTGEGGGVLLDTAVGRFKDYLYERVKGVDLKLILLTHGHPDHTGNTAYLSAATGAPVGMHAADAELTKSVRMRKMYADTFLGKMLLAGTTASVYKPSAFELQHKFDGGEDLTEFGVGGAKVVALPGHTAGSIGVLTDGGDFIVGDSMMNILKPTKARMYEDGATLKKSLETIGDSGCKTIMTGHGDPFPASIFFNTL